MLSFVESEDEATIALAPNIGDCESVPESVPVWGTELHKNGSYYEGIVTDLEETLLRLLLQHMAQEEAELTKLRYFISSYGICTLYASQ